MKVSPGIIFKWGGKLVEAVGTEEIKIQVAENGYTVRVIPYPIMGGMASGNGGGFYKSSKIYIVRDKKELLKTIRDLVK